MRTATHALATLPRAAAFALAAQPKFVALAFAALPLSAALVVAALPLSAAIAFAAPEVSVEVHSGVPQISLLGDFRGSRYTVWRGGSLAGPFAPITQIDLLCVSICFADDRSAVPGATYWYRFDVESANAPPRSFGPYAVRIPAPYPGEAALRAYPNPASGPSHVELYLRGAVSDAPAPAEAIVLDMQGRRVRTLWSGPLARGLTTVSWDGRDQAGRALAPGSYTIRFRSPGAVVDRRIVRVR